MTKPPEAHALLTPAACLPCYGMLASVDTQMKQHKRWFGPGVRGTVWLVVAAALGFIIVRAIGNPLNYESDKPLAILAFFILLCVMLFVALRSTYRAFRWARNKLPDPVSPSSFLLKALFLLGLAGVFFCAEVAAVTDQLTSGKITVLGIPDFRALWLTVAMVSVPALALTAAGFRNLGMYLQQRQVPKKEL
jgi:cell division protein FtsW (lipid II flippase)